MQTKFLFTFTIFVACVAYVNAATGDSCSSAQSITDLKTATDGTGIATYQFTPVAMTVATTDVGTAQSFDKGTCKYNYAANSANTQVGYWFKYVAPPGGDVLASIELTNAANTPSTQVRLLIFSTDSDSCGGVGDSSTWTCETRIVDMCQGYPTQPSPYNFKSGRTYHFFIHAAAQPTVAGEQFFINFVKRTVLFGENFESVSTEGSLPTGWTRSSKSTYGGWNVTSPANANSESSTVTAIGTGTSGGIGNRILYLNPFKNGAYSRSQCISLYPTQPSLCDHTNDSVVTPSFSLTTYSDAQLLFTNYFTDGSTSVGSSSTLNGTIWVSVAQGAFTQLSKMVPVVNADADPKYNTEKFSLKSVAGNSDVRIMFKFEGTINVFQFGWVIDNIQVVPISTYDMCEDGFSCTLHTCSATSTPLHGCANVKNDSICSAATVTCMTSTCNPGSATTTTPGATGCTNTPNNTKCDDQITCTLDICDNTDPQSNVTTGCVNKERNAECNDNKQCTVDACYGRLNPLFGKADPTTGCYNKDGCDDDVDCTTDTCEKVPGYDDKCLHTIDFQKCDDKIDCTYELTCDPEQPGYDAVKGCIRIPMHEWCDDNDPCTIDTCDSSLGLPNSCVNTNVTCDDCLQCTVDYCVDGACEHEPVHEMCDDGFACTVDICDESLGKCTNNANDTYCQNFALGCEIAYCRPHASADDSGCVVEQKICDDEIACTEDMCDDLTGECFFVANSTKCDDDLPCTDDVCDAYLGKCTNKPNSNNCDDQDKCTIDFCSMNGTCDSFPKDCSDEILCTDDYCDANGDCQNDANKTRCDDGFACTQDVCDKDLGRCTNLPSDLYCTERGNPCFVHYCNVESSPDDSGCYSVEKDCSDAITCTYDYCDPTATDGQYCKHVANDTFCDDGHDCTDDVCDIELGRCTNFANNDNCNDGNICTVEDICGSDGECHYVDKDCNDQIYCTVDGCDPNLVDGCFHHANHTLCDDGNDCTDDYCDVDIGRCVNTPRDDWCPGRSSCESGTCSLALGCVYESHDDWCEDLVGCTLDVCTGPGGCVFETRDSLCDDGIGCTADTCNKTGCVYTPHNDWCDDGISCTDNICSTTSDCLNPIIPNSCDDSINCTNDWCSLTADCQNDPVNSWCSDGVACTDDVCDPTDSNGEYCHNIAQDYHCEDGFSCSENTCDFDMGCVTNYTQCPWFERTLDDKICIECMSSSGQIEQVHYEDGTGAMAFRTLSADSGSLSDKMVLTPDNTVIIGGSQSDIPIGKASGLVVGNNMRIVPQEAGSTLPECNEIRRGTFVVTQQEVDCGEDTCHEDVIQICVKDQTYHYVTLSTEKTSL